MARFSMRDVSLPSQHEQQPMLSVRHIEHATHGEWYLTAQPWADRADTASEVFAALAELIAARGISLLQEKVYGRRSAQAAILDERARAYSAKGLDPTLPVTFLEGAPASGAVFAGVQSWGVTLGTEANQRVETVLRQGLPVGREWFGPGFRQLVLSSVDGRSAASPAAHETSAPEQAQRMLEQASALLATRGYSFHNVARTWLYLSHILDWYGDFNRVRNAHYAAAGLSRELFPASTGIEARHGSKHCSMDLLAIEPQPESSLTVRPLLRSSRQDLAFSYGSAFSRAMVIEQHDTKIIHVSGTASIDTDGRSTHAGDTSAQYCETLLSIAALLEDEGASLSSICQGTLFCKSAEVAVACRDAARRLGLKKLPLIEVLADVCRPELLLEIEAVAIV